MVESGIETTSEIDANATTTMIELPNELYQQTLMNIIKDKCDFSDSNYKINIEAGSAKGDNYIGVLYRATV